MKKQLVNVRIEVLSDVSTRNLLSESPYVDRVHSGTSILKIWRDLGRERFDFILDLEGTWRSLVLTTFFAGDVFRRFRWSPRVQRFFGQNEFTLHKVDQVFAVANKLGVTNDQEAIDFVIPYKDEVPIEWLPSEYQNGYCVVCIDGSYSTRRLPAKRLIELCDKINKPVILIGGKQFAEEAHQVELFFARQRNSESFEEGLRELNKKTHVYNGCGKFNLNQQASLVKQASYIFTYDNHFIAIASAFRKETIVIWGNTVPDQGGYPYLTRFTLLENTRLKCRPCSSKGFSKCPLQHFKCMNDVSFDFYIR